MSSKPKLRSFGDRLRQIALFEIGGLLLVTPPFAWASGVPIAESIGLLAVLALIASIWNGSYNTCFDWVEGRVTGRTADRRPFRLRCAHALGFEMGLFCMTLPIIVWWTAMGWVEAAGVMSGELASAGTAWGAGSRSRSLPRWKRAPARTRATRACPVDQVAGSRSQMRMAATSMVPRQTKSRLS